MNPTAATGCYIISSMDTMEKRVALSFNIMRGLMLRTIGGLLFLGTCKQTAWSSCTRINPVDKCH